MRREIPEIGIIREEADLHWEKICCLKLGRDGELGRITLNPFPSNPLMGLKIG